MERLTPTKKKKVIIDPVCGMNVPHRKTDIVANYQGGIYHFCAEACRRSFEKNPQKYLECKTTKRKGWWGRYLERLERATGNKPLKCH